MAETGLLHSFYYHRFDEPDRVNLYIHCPHNLYLVLVTLMVKICLVLEISLSQRSHIRSLVQRETYFVTFEENFKVTESSYRQVIHNLPELRQAISGESSQLSSEE